MLGEPWGRGRLFREQPANIKFDQPLFVDQREAQSMWRVFWMLIWSPFSITWDHSEAIWRCAPDNWRFWLGEVVDHAGSHYGGESKSVDRWYIYWSMELSYSGMNFMSIAWSWGRSRFYIHDQDNTCWLLLGCWKKVSKRCSLTESIFNMPSSSTRSSLLDYAEPRSVQVLFQPSKVYMRLAWLPFRPSPQRTRKLNANLMSSLRERHRDGARKRR